MKYSTDGKHIFVIYDRRKPNPNWIPKEQEMESEKEEEEELPEKDNDSGYNDKKESEGDLNKQIVVKDQEESEEEDEDKYIMVKHIAIMTSDKLKITYNGILGTGLEVIARADLVWNS